MRLNNLEEKRIAILESKASLPVNQRSKLTWLFCLHDHTMREVRRGPFFVLVTLAFAASSAAADGDITKATNEITNGVLWSVSVGGTDGQDP